jgi:hypothetical protein
MNDCVMGGNTAKFIYAQAISRVLPLKSGSFGQTFTPEFGLPLKPCRLLPTGSTVLTAIVVLPRAAPITAIQSPLFSDDGTRGSYTPEVLPITLSALRTEVERLPSLHFPSLPSNQLSQHRAIDPDQRTLRTITTPVGKTPVTLASGLMSGGWKRGMARRMRHRQTKGPETAGPDLNYRATSRLYDRPPLDKSSARRVGRADRRAQQRAFSWSFLVHD